MHYLEILWYISLAILFSYHLIIFRIPRQRPVLNTPTDPPGVSIIIAVKNGSDQLSGNLRTFMVQDYPLFEIIVVDDYSDTGEKRKLEEAIFDLPQVILHHSNRKPGKKNALTLGIEKAKHGFILCTDADCSPVDKTWISNMMKQGGGNNVVLGYSPYILSSGWLNRIIRFETVMTGIQYLSWAGQGKPYMGVGRNILYPKDLFQKTDPYQDQGHIPYGDDDLWVQAAASSTPINVCVDKSAHVYSRPATSWANWFRQKHRHMSAGHYYTSSAWWRPGLYGITLIIHWLLVIVLAIVSLNQWVIILFCLGLLVRWITYARWTRVLGDRDTIFWYPVLELFYAAYLAGMGLITTLKKKKTWN